jgi:hypothetical protein
MVDTFSCNITDLKLGVAPKRRVKFEFTESTTGPDRFCPMLTIEHLVMPRADAHANTYLFSSMSFARLRYFLQRNETTLDLPTSIDTFSTIIQMTANFVKPVGGGLLIGVEVWDDDEDYEGGEGGETIYKLGNVQIYIGANDVKGLVAALNSVENYDCGSVPTDAEIQLMFKALTV